MDSEFLLDDSYISQSIQLLEKAGSFERQSLGSMGGGQGVPEGQGGHLGDPLQPSGWFDESSDES